MCKWKPIYSYHSFPFFSCVLFFRTVVLNISHLSLFCASLGPHFVCMILFNNLITYYMQTTNSKLELGFKVLSLICIARDFSRLHFCNASIHRETSQDQKCSRDQIQRFLINADICYQREIGTILFLLKIKWRFFSIYLRMVSHSIDFKEITDCFRLEMFLFPHNTFRCSNINPFSPSVDVVVSLLSWLNK